MLTNNIKLYKFSKIWSANNLLDFQKYKAQKKFTNFFLC